jgi:hypothetical protein
MTNTYQIKVTNKNNSILLHSSNDAIEMAHLCRNLHDESKKHIVKKGTKYQFILSRQDGEHTLCDSSKLLDLAFIGVFISRWDSQEKSDKFYNKVIDFPAEWLTPKKIKGFVDAMKASA